MSQKIQNNVNVKTNFGLFETPSFTNFNNRSTYEVKCKSDLTYDIPVPESDWPQCIDRLDCPAPDLFDPYVFTSDWQSGDSLTPPFTG